MRDFNHTVGVLVKAYFNNTLQHGNCYACAVGNLICEANGYGYKLGKNGGLIWSIPTIAFWYDPLESTGKVMNSGFMNEAKQQCASIGYTIEEVAKIEYAFEGAEVGQNDDDYMFNGLMAVVDVLAEIHGIDLKEREDAKLLFVKS